MSESDELPSELKNLVHEVFDIWGEVINEEGGSVLFNKVEFLREYLKYFRDESPLSEEINHIEELYRKMAKLSRENLSDVTHAFSMLLELINACENSVRSLKIKNKQGASFTNPNPDQEIYLVLTAHPTESRAPEIVEILQQIQKILSSGIFDDKGSLSFRLKPYFRKLWYMRMAREQKPQVKDEAEYIYSILFRPEILDILLRPENEKVFFRTWVGGDKDGHPGVDEKIMLQSLNLSRHHLLINLKKYVHRLEKELHSALSLSRKKTLSLSHPSVKLLKAFSQSLDGLSLIKANDLSRVKKTNLLYNKFDQSLKLHPLSSLINAQKIKSILRIFPGLVVPLELRESSDVFADNLKKPEASAIFRMLKTLKQISGANPRPYARGLIISMAKDQSDLENAEFYLKKALGPDCNLPIIPLFEQAEDLKNSAKVTEAWIRARKLKKFEVMLGYSDSSKEAGVLPSRLEIRKALNELHALTEKIPGLRLTYFHGSGGSVARGGGSLESQTAHWPPEAFARYKVTLQGEMIQRTFSTPEILEQYLFKVRTLALNKKFDEPMSSSATLEKFSLKISNFYRNSISNPQFLESVEKASAYRFLAELKFGSRPSKRKKLEGVSSLRAIPWILAWTQVRNILPTWWGFGTAFAEMKASEKKSLQALAGGKDPLFTSVLQQIGFTLAKVESEVWFLYLEHSTLSAKEKKTQFADYLKELNLAISALKFLTGADDSLWFKPWLKESIRLRSPMIHPLNVAQLLAWKSHDAALVREASVGIACGMLTTG